MRLRPFFFAAAALSFSSQASAQSFNVDITFPSVPADIVSNTFGGAADRPGSWNNIEAAINPRTITNVSGETATLTTRHRAATRIGTGESDAGRLRRIAAGNSGDAAWGFDFTGLRPGFYDVYVYSGTNPNRPTGPYTVNGLAAPSISSAGEDSLVEGMDWRVTRNVVVAQGSLSIFNAEPSLPRMVAAIQIVERTTFATLVDVVTLPTGDASCTDGGVRIDIGRDNGAGGGTLDDGVLSSGEVERSSFVCNGIDGVDGVDGVDGADGSSCTIDDNDDGTATVSCGNGSTFVVRDGNDGVDGTDGEDGEDGTDGVDGEDGVDGVDGVDGEDGANGVDGTDGADGASCTVVEQDDGSAVITCPDGSTATIGEPQPSVGGGGCSQTTTTPTFAFFAAALALVRRRRSR